MSRNLKPKGDLRPELFVFGSMVGGESFDPDLGPLSCDLTFVVSNDWEKISDPGLIQTQMSLPDPESGDRIWTQPFELFYAPKAIEGWPVGVIQVWRSMGSGRQAPIAYGRFPVPFGEGRHTLDVHTWSPIGDCQLSQVAYYFGTYPHLRHFSALSQNDARWNKVKCATSGRVRVELTIVRRNFDT